MVKQKTEKPARQKSLRLWPGILIVIVQWLARYGLPAVMPDETGTAVLIGVAGGLAIIIWWVFFSRAPWLERLGAIALMVVAMIATSQVVHESIATGAQGMLLVITAIPVLSLALVVWAVLTRRMGFGARWAALAAIVLLVCGGLAAIRTGGVTGNFESDFAWRWSETPEERLLSQGAEEPLPTAPETAVADTLETDPATPIAETLPAPPADPATVKTPEKPSAVKADDAVAAVPAAPATVKPAPEWPGFRGPKRDGIVRGTRIETDWAASPPVELWRHPVGPGWSSFSVRGGLIYTQEQRGEEEMVSCYRLADGEPLWRHSDPVRFWESNGGAGPRATPTLSEDRVYSFGATGILNALDAADGTVIWSRDVAADTDRKVPTWGFASSPLVVDSLVIVAAAGDLAAYEIATGNPRWFGPDSGWGYSSPHLATIDGVLQIVLLNGSGAIGLAPGDGKLLWQYAWPGDGIVQPVMLANQDVLIGTGSGLGSGVGIGVRRVSLVQNAGGWAAEERWTSRGLKPYFNDFVVHAGHAFGFDGSILSCIRLEDGERQWKGGRYGHGQLVLLPEQDLLLVLSEKGELALVRALPDQFTELARFPALSGKTWNHPVLVGDILLVRNGQEMAAFRVGER